MREVIKVQVKETSYALVLGGSGAEAMPTSRCLRRVCVRTITEELILEQDIDRDQFSGDEK